MTLAADRKTQTSVKPCATIYYGESRWEVRKMSVKFDASFLFKKVYLRSTYTNYSDSCVSIKPL